MCGCIFCWHFRSKSKEISRLIFFLVLSVLFLGCRKWKEADFAMTYWCKYVRLCGKSLGALLFFSRACKIRESQVNSRVGTQSTKLSSRFFFQLILLNSRTKIFNFPVSEWLALFPLVGLSCRAVHVSFSGIAHWCIIRERDTGPIFR